MKMKDRRQEEDCEREIKYVRKREREREREKWKKLGLMHSIFFMNHKAVKGEGTVEEDDI